MCDCKNALNSITMRSSLFKINRKEVKYIYSAQQWCEASRSFHHSEHCTEPLLSSSSQDRYRRDEGGEVRSEDVIRNSVRSAHNFLCPVTCNIFDQLLTGDIGVRYPMSLNDTFLTSYIEHFLYILISLLGVCLNWNHGSCHVSTICILVAVKRRLESVRWFITTWHIMNISIFCWSISFSSILIAYLSMPCPKL